MKAAAEYSKPAGEIIIYKDESSIPSRQKNPFCSPGTRGCLNKTHEKWVYEVESRYRTVLLTSQSKLARK